MTNVTEELDRLDKAVLEFVRASAGAEDYASVPSHEIIQTAQMKADAEVAAQTGPFLESLFWSATVFHPEPFRKVISRSFERQHTILMGRIERYLESRTWETEAVHSITLDPASIPSGQGDDRAEVLVLTTNAIEQGN